MEEIDHDFCHEEAGFFEKEFYSCISTFTKYNAKSDIKLISQSLSYIRMKSNELIKDTDYLLGKIKKDDISIILDSLFTIKTDIDFLLDEADKIKAPLVDLINEIVELTDSGK